MPLTGKSLQLDTGVANARDTFQPSVIRYPGTIYCPTFPLAHSWSMG
jgi:hypothetical protein